MCLCMQVPLSIYPCKGLRAPMDMINLCAHVCIYIYMVIVVYNYIIYNTMPPSVCPCSIHDIDALISVN